MSKKEDASSKVILHSGAVLSAFGLLVVAGEAQANEPLVALDASLAVAETEETFDNWVAITPDTFTTTDNSSISFESESLASDSPNYDSFSLTTSLATSVATETASVEPMPTDAILPTQNIQPRQDFAAYATESVVPPIESYSKSYEERFIAESLTVVAAAPALPEETAIASAIEALPIEPTVQVEGETFVAIAPEKEAVDKELRLPQPDWANPTEGLVATSATELAQAELSTPTVELIAVGIEEDESEEEELAQSEFPTQSVELIAFDIEEAESDEEEEDAESTSTLVALRSAEEQRAQKREAPWIAVLNVEDEATEETVKAPWLALSDVEEDESVPRVLRGTRLVLNSPERSPAKRPDNWVSLTPFDQDSPDNSADRDELAIVAPSSNAPRVYDTNILSQAAITPNYLANANETEVEVGASEVEFLAPESGAFLDIPSTPVVLRFPVGAKIALMANGQEVDTNLVGRTETDSATGLRTQTWYGVVLTEGDNLLEVVSTETGEVLQSLPLVVRGAPEELVLLSPRSIPADGRSTSDIRGQLLDKDGNISLWGTVATLRTSDGQFLGADYDVDAPGFQVLLSNGEFVAELQSSLDPKLVQLQARVGTYEAFSQIQFVTQQRPSLISGVVDLRLGANGTDYYESFREFLPIDEDNRYELDVDAAVFATGNIGEWLYTGAYNSDRTLNENCQGETTLFNSGAGGCGHSYALYGDDSQSGTVAPSLDSVYLRLERNSPSRETSLDYAMWGDFNTSEFSAPSQLFTSTSRQLHGFKARYNFGNLAATGLYANNVDGFRRDTIAPDGTSGLYFTSERDIVPGSENVYFELEELERPGTVLERRELARGVDYQIDYDRGTLLFDDPVRRTSIDDFGQLLVRRIVTTYQYESGDDTNVVAGRLQYTFDDKQNHASWVGATYLTEDQGNRNFSVYGADAQVSIGENVLLTAEVAESASDFDATGETVRGSAYRFNAEGSFSRLSSRAYFRTTDAGFSNSATTSFVPGQTRYGAQLAAQIGPTTSLRAQFDHEDNFGETTRVSNELSPLLAGLAIEEGTTSRSLDNSLTTYSLGISQKFGELSADLDWISRDRSDRLSEDNNVSSAQLRSRLSYQIAPKLSLIAQHELNLSSDVDPIYPSRTLLGLNWQAMPWLNVGVDQIFYGGGGNDRGSVTSINVGGEHTFASDTKVRGRFSTIDGRQIGGTIGLEQGINLAPGLDLDFGYEKTFSTVGNRTAVGEQVGESIAIGNSASALALSGGESYSVGLSYTDSADFQGSTRFEHRRSSRGSNTVFNLSAVGRLSPSFSVLGDYQLASSANRNVVGIGTTSELKLGVAYRNPADDRFNALLRYEHRMNPSTIPSARRASASSETQEHLVATEAIYTPNWRWELYGKYALRNSRTNVSTTSDTEFSSSSTVQLAQARATYRLAYSWDVVGEARWIGGDNYNEVGYAVEAGYYPLPDLRLSAGYSGGAVDSDFSNSRSAGGFYVGVTAKLSNLFDGFGTQPMAPRQSQESVIEVDSELQPMTAPVNEEFPNAVDL